MKAVLRACFAVGVRGAANPLIGLEVLVAGALALSLVAGPKPAPVVRQATWVCWRSQLHCQELSAEAHHEAAEDGLVEVTP